MIIEGMRVWPFTDFGRVFTTSGEFVWVSGVETRHYGGGPTYIILTCPCLDVSDIAQYRYETRWDVGVPQFLDGE